MIGGQSIGASLIITRHFDRQVLNVPVFNTFYQLKNGNYRLTETLFYGYRTLMDIVRTYAECISGKMYVMDLNFVTLDQI